MKLQRVAIALIAIIALSAGAYYVRNPEKGALDDAARRNAPGKFVQLSDGITHYDVSGPDSGQRVLLVHGFSVPYYIWDSTAIMLSTVGYRVARYDHFGRGYSDRPDLRYNADLYDRQMLQLLDSLGWREPVDVVGLSMGGAVSAEFVARHPERVRSHVLVDPAAGTRGNAPAMFRLPVIGPLLWQVVAVPGMAESQFGDFVEPAKWPDWADRYRVQTQYRGFGRALLSTLVEGQGMVLDSVYARAGAQNKRTLLLWGKEDKTVPIERAASVTKAIPHAKYHPIDGAGHLPHMERADLVAPLLLLFLHDGAGPDSTVLQQLDAGRRKP